jgi:hypothetical protein
MYFCRITGHGAWKAAGSNFWHVCADDTNASFSPNRSEVGSELVVSVVLVMVEYRCVVGVGNLSSLATDLQQH